jgi:hypothetical protein
MRRDRAVLAPLAKRSREQLGLATDRPIIMSGHQAELWHPGIAAKAFAMSHAAIINAGQPVWLNVDQDANEPTQIAYPTQDLTRGIWSLDGVRRAGSSKVEGEDHRSASRRACKHRIKTRTNSQVTRRTCKPKLHRRSVCPSSLRPARWFSTTNPVPSRNFALNHGCIRRSFRTHAARPRAMYAYLQRCSRVCSRRKTATLGNDQLAR